MNAPAKPAQLETADFKLIPLDQLVPSPTNPRTRRGLDEASLGELAQNILAVGGVAQPILIRKMSEAQKKESWPFPTPGKAEAKQGDRFEIVCGERRYHASKRAGLTQIPAMLRELTDIQVLQIQLAENVQREDLDEMEEAEGYEKLMQEKDSDGKPYTAERIAEFMGVSRATIYARLKLLALCPDARDAFYDDKLEASTALLIARISPDKIQMEALKEILRQEMSYRQARDHIQRNYMLELKQAIFDIKDAVLVKKSGACTDCPKRTGNQPGLFDDVKSKDVCTDPVCFGMKKAAHFLIVRNKAEVEGAKIISGKKAQKILPSNYSQDHYLGEHGFARPSAPIPNDPKGRTWEQALKQTKLLDAKDGKKPPIQQTLIENPHNKGEIIQAISINEAAKALREQGYEVTLRSQSGKPVKTEKEKAEDAKLKAKTKAENLYRARLVETIHAKADHDLYGDTPQLRPEVFRLLAKEIFDQSKAYAAKNKLAEAALGEKATEMGSREITAAYPEHLDTLSPQQCMLIMIDLIMAKEEKAEDWQVKNNEVPDILLALAAMHEIDAAAIKAQAEQEIKAEAEAKKKDKKPAAAPAKKAKAPEPAPVRKSGGWPFPTPGIATS